MSEADRLLRGVLDDPSDEALRLVLADWLEERGDGPSRARADLLRLQVEWARRELQDELTARADELLAAWPEVGETLAPLAEFSPVLAMRSLPLFLVAPLADVHGGPLAAGSEWRGHLVQTAYEFPTSLWLRDREGNAVSGDMEQDFTAIYGWPGEGRFFFRGVVFGRDRLAFVTHRLEGSGSHPGHYLLRTGRGGRLLGPWQVPRTGQRGQLRLVRVPE